MKSINLKCLDKLPFAKFFSQPFLERLSLEIKETQHFSEEIILYEDPSS